MPRGTEDPSLDSSSAMTGVHAGGRLCAGRPRHRRRWLSTPLECGIDQVTLAKFVECFPFTLNRHLSRSDAGL